MRPVRAAWYPPLVSASPGRACPACGGPERSWASKNKHQLTRCRNCGTVVARREDDAAPSSADYESYHAEATFAPAASTQGSLDALVSDACRYRHQGRWLDFGYGEGSLLQAAQRCGWECAGVEVSPHALAFGRSRGWTVFDPAEALGRLPPGAFDVVTLVEVIEHLPEPARALSCAVGWLRPGGLLFLTTPNADSLNRRVLGPRWSVVCPPEHLTIWSARGLRVVLRRLGLARLRVRTHGLNPVEILASVRWATDRPVHRQQAAEALSGAFGRTATRRLFKKVANGTLSLLGIGDTIKVWCERPT